MNEGAVILYGNKLEDSSQIDVTSGAFTNVTNLGTGTLSPKAEFTGSIQFEITGLTAIADQVQVNAIAILGCVYGFNSGTPAFTVEYENPVASGTWIEVEHDLVVVEPNSFQPRHFVLLLREDIIQRQPRVSIQLGLETMEIGEIFVGKFIQAPELADAGWSVRPSDVGTKDESEGGQIYADSGAVTREFEIQHATLSPQYLYGFPKDLERITLPTPTVVAGTATVDGQKVTATTAGTVTVRWSGILSASSSYVFNYSAGIFGVGVAASYPELSLDNADGSYPLDYLLAGRRAKHFRQASGTNLDVTFIIASGQTVELEALGLFETSDTPPYLQGVAGTAGIANLPSLSEMIALEGTSGLVGVILRPSDPLYSTWTAAFGYIESFSPYRDRSGTLSGGGFRLRETL